MGRSAKAFRRSAGDPDWGGLEQSCLGAGLYRRPTVVLARSPVVCRSRPGGRSRTDHVRKRAVRRPMGRDLRRPLNGTFAALSR